MQLFFLLVNDITGYKLASHVYDLTSAQIEFYRICAEKIQKALRDARNNANTTTDDSINIDTENDSPEVVQEKLDMIKNIMRR